MNKYEQIKAWAAKGVNAGHITTMLNLSGQKVYCFGSYYTSPVKGGKVAWFITDKGTKVELLDNQGNVI